MDVLLSGASKRVGAMHTLRCQACRITPPSLVWREAVILDQFYFLTLLSFYCQQKGSLFELLGEGEPQLGFAATAAIATIGLPSGLFLLYAAILKATAETEEDDARFMSGK